MLIITRFKSIQILFYTQCARRCVDALECARNGKSANFFGKHCCSPSLICRIISALPSNPSLMFPKSSVALVALSAFLCKPVHRSRRCFFFCSWYYSQDLYFKIDRYCTQTHEKKNSTTTNQPKVKRMKRVFHFTVSLWTWNTQIQMLHWIWTREIIGCQWASASGTSFIYHFVLRNVTHAPAYPT